MCTLHMNIQEFIHRKIDIFILLIQNKCILTYNKPETFLHVSSVFFLQNKNKYFYFSKYLSQSLHDKIFYFTNTLF